MENFFNNEKIFRSLWKWKIHITIVVFAAILLSVIITSPFIIKPKFKSTGKVYPVNTMTYSEESESEQMLEDIRSVDNKFRLIDAFHLDKVYMISKSDPLYKTYMLAEFDKNVSFKKTEFETIEIKVLDESPQRASDMVDSLILYFDQLLQRQFAIKYLEVAEIAKKDLQNKNREIDSVQAVLSDLSKKYGILDYDTQVKAATEGLMNAAALKGDTKPSKELLDNLKENGIEFKRLSSQLHSFQRVADSLKIQYDFGISQGMKKITYSIVVERPFPADKKSYPVRWLIVMLSTIAALAASVITVLMIDFYRERIAAK
ncbi:MAG TPA: Wzz/FepE/Etk N-terminal domain-containing protein [Prolixibacteraceae bacterium]|nr:Wzz/FepE/Etk N-terminal domain-containing protein [Prolixibacteraceae bacterium]HPS11665.1 Wzz/FepE/Etk N-terminal domain-containing protein [Prolixibacteraceae bacterium]